MMDAQSTAWQEVWMRNIGTTEDVGNRIQVNLRMETTNVLFQGTSVRVPLHFRVLPWYLLGYT